MGMQAQSASHPPPPPPPLPPPPSCCAQSGSSPACRLGRTAGRSRRARPRLFPAVPEAHGNAMAATELGSIRHHRVASIIAAPACNTQRNTGQGCCCTVKTQQIHSNRGRSGMPLAISSIAWPGYEQSRLMQRDTNTHTRTHLGRHNGESEYLSSSLHCDLKTRLSSGWGKNSRRSEK